MEKCYFSKKYILYTRINMICGVLSGSTLILIGILVGHESRFWCSIMFVLGILVMVYTRLFVTFLNRKYHLSEEGITIQYAHRYTVFYPWAAIQSACIGITHRSGTGTTQDTVIWCTTKKGKCPPPTESRRHISWEYDFCHWNSVITIEFSEKRYFEFAGYYQESIYNYC